MNEFLRVRMTSEDLEALEQAAQIDGRTVSNLVRLIVRQWLARDAQTARAA